jgi:hypothetical protein
MSALAQLDPRTADQRWRFVREKWLKRVAADKKIPFDVYEAAFLLAGIVNDKTHEVWAPSSKLARAMSRQKTTNAIRLLVCRGHLTEVDDPQRGKPRPKYYRCIVRAMQPACDAACAEAAS